MERGRELAQMVDDEEARVEAEETAEAEAVATQAEEAEQEQREKRAEYHLHRFFEFAGIEHPEDGVICPVCHMGFVPVEMRVAPGDRRCEICGGVGRTLTMSLVPGNEERICGHCKGAGYFSEQPAQEVIIPPPIEQPNGAEPWQAPIIPPPPVQVP